jgi:hypothetical protein
MHDRFNRAKLKVCAFWHCLRIGLIPGQIDSRSLADKSAIFPDAPLKIDSRAARAVAKNCVQIPNPG